MAFEAVRGYVQLASGLGEMTKAKALEAAQGLLALPRADEIGKRAMQASVLADQILEAAKANRSNLIALVRTEIENALGRAEFARHSDVENARAAVASLNREVEELRAAVLAGVAHSPLGRMIPGMASSAVTTGPRQSWLREVPPAAEPGRPRAAGTRTTAGSASAKKAAAKKTTAKKTAAKKATTAKKTAAKKTTAKKTAAKKTAAKKTAAKKTAAKKTTAKKTTTARKATTKKATAAPETVPTAAVETAPVESAAVETAPVESAAVETAPVESAAVETAPVESAAVETPAEKTEDTRTESGE